MATASRGSPLLWCTAIVMSASTIHQSSSRAHSVLPLIGSLNSLIQVTWMSALAESVMKRKRTGIPVACQSVKALRTWSTWSGVQSFTVEVGWIHTLSWVLSGQRASDESWSRRISAM